MLSLLHVKRLSLALLLLSDVAVGFPSAAGSCDAGTDALLQPAATEEILRIHGNLMQLGTGPLSEYDLSVELDGTVLDPSVAADFTYGVEHQLALTSGNATQQFKGFLVRMGSTDGARTIDSLLPIPDEIDADGKALVQVADSTCKFVQQVGGVTQVNSVPKNQVNMTLFMEGPSTGLQLDVTVVIKTSLLENVSHWYYDRFTLNAIDPPGTPTTPAPDADGPASTPGPTSSPIDDKADTSGESPEIPSEGPSSGGGVLTTKLFVATTVLAVATAAAVVSLSL